VGWSSAASIADIPDGGYVDKHSFPAIQANVMISPRPSTSKVDVNRAWPDFTSINLSGSLG